MCGFCDIQAKKKDFQKDPILSDEEVERYLQQIWIGSINVYNLPVHVYEKIGEFLTKAVLEGFGGIVADWTTKDKEMIKALLENTYAFSGGKTFQQVYDIQQYIIEDGKVVPFSEFKKKVLPIYEDYNINWLSAEYDTAISSARSASKWLEIINDKETLPLIKYVTVGDSRVREEHKTLDHVIKPVGDPFWNTYFPPNGWRCRCTVYQLESGEVTATEIENAFREVEKINPLFSFNPGKRKMVFSPKHPYFKVPEEYKWLAKQNFGLPWPTINLNSVRNSEKLLA